MFSNLTALSGLQINLNREARIDRGVVDRGVKLYDKLNFEHGSKQNYCPVIKVFFSSFFLFCFKFEPPHICHSISNRCPSLPLSVQLLRL